MQLDVQTFDTGCSDKEQAVKVLEEAAEVFGAWQEFEYFWHEQYHIDEETRWVVEDRLADEIADVITAACNLASQIGVDVESALLRTAERNHQRGRC